MAQAQPPDTGATHNAHYVPAYEVLARDILSRGHTNVFALVSDDTALLIATLDAIGVRVHAARHENTAVAMAEGYAAATGTLGIAIIGRGPATANALHGAMYAHRAGSRVLLIFGASSLGQSGGLPGQPRTRACGCGSTRRWLRRWRQRVPAGGA